MEIMHPPGHTPGSISVACDGAIYTGDLILPEGTEAMHLEEADETDREESLRKVIEPRTAARETTIYPGHGESFIFQAD